MEAEYLEISLKLSLPTLTLEKSSRIVKRKEKEKKELT